MKDNLRLTVQLALQNHSYISDSTAAPPYENEARPWFNSDCAAFSKSTATSPYENDARHGFNLKTSSLLRSTATKSNENNARESFDFI